MLLLNSADRDKAYSIATALGGNLKGGILPVSFHLQIFRNYLFFQYNELFFFKFI